MYVKREAVESFQLADMLMKAFGMKTFVLLPDADPASRTRPPRSSGEWECYRIAYVLTDGLHLLTGAISQSETRTFRTIAPYVLPDSKAQPQNCHLQFRNSSSSHRGARMPPGRRRVTGNGRKELKHARTCFSNSRKLETVLYFENHNVNETLDKFFFRP
ncbi:hypothetical protein F444_13177 [Phytophthora nicotianae P1976]|uniref:Uncharacterized protein n=1 Tax=Phytophthora nicotianae P1976 TaxID=1317066 RepID=A0A080ZUN2_PHYNI|nr:hypothetical protein F444_13177 [Phytophthora nicotianae P1976]